MKRGFLILCILTISVFSFAQKIELEGTCQGKNIYVQNPADATGVFNCTEKILVNGKEISFKNTSAFEIKLDSLGFKTGDTVKIEIFHKPDCKPKVLNTNITCIPKCTYEIVSIFIDSIGILNWVAKGEIGILPFIIEQYRWNKWIKVGEVFGKGGLQENTYSFQTIPHSGKNQFRVKQIDSNNCGKRSEFVYFDSTVKKPKVKSYSIGPNGLLEFDRETMYEIYDMYGNIVKKGTGKLLDCSKLQRGSYYLNYDNAQEQFNKYY